MRKGFTFALVFLCIAAVAWAGGPGSRNTSNEFEVSGSVISVAIQTSIEFGHVTTVEVDAGIGGIVEVACVGQMAFDCAELDLILPVFRRINGSLQSVGSSSGAPIAIPIAETVSGI